LFKGNTMKTIAILTVLAAAAFVSIAVQAQSAEATSRSVVSAELQRARASGELDHARQEINGPSAALGSAQPVAVSGVAPGRIAVTAELQRARANGELDWASAELGGAQAPTKAAASMALR
jgi:hypothetical protein